MPKWTEYTSKDTLADNDEVMLYDATARANKRGLMSKFWDYVVDKMATAVISKLETNNKTIIGAINALNGKTHYRVLTGGQSMTIKIASYRTTFVIVATKCFYIYSNGYLTKIQEEPDRLEIKLSSDYLTVTIKNINSGDEANCIGIYSFNNDLLIK